MRKILVEFGVLLIIFLLKNECAFDFSPDEKWR